MNVVNLFGTIGKDAELHTFNDGNSIMKFSVATNDGYYSKAKQEFIENTTWHNIEKNITSPEQAQKYTKGRQVAICGRIKTTKIDDGTGNSKYFTSIVANKAELTFNNNAGGGGISDSLNNTPMGAATNNLTSALGTPANNINDDFIGGSGKDDDVIF